MKRIIISVLFPALIISCTRGNEKENDQKAANTNENANLIPVKIVSVKTALVCDSIPATGLVTTENEARLSFKIGGVIDRIFVREGQFVTKGELLATLKSTEINAQLDQANLSLEKAQRDYSRVNNLYIDSVATLEQLQNTKTALDIAKKAAASVAFNHQYAFIKAAYSGFVTGKIANEGEVVAPGAPVLMIGETGAGVNWILRVGVTDAEWSSISLGQKALVRLDAFTGKTFTGSVYRKSRTADQASGSFQMDIRINFSKETPATGMFGKAVIIPEKQVNEMTIPYEALVQINGNKAFVYTPDPNGSLQKIEVVIRSFNEKDVIIETGLTEGQQVVVSNNAFLNEKSKISMAK